MPVKERLIQSFHKTYERFVRIRGHPRQIALGLALGIFVGVMPILGLQIASAVLLAALFRWNKISAALGTLVTNPVTMPFIYMLTYFVGGKFLAVKGDQPELVKADLETLVMMFRKTPDVLMAMALGGVAVGLPLAVLGYVLSYRAVARYQQQIKEKVARQRERLRQRRKRLAAGSNQLRQRIRERTERRKKQKSNKKLTRRQRRKRSNRIG